MFLKKIFFAGLILVLLTGLLVVSCSQPTNSSNPVNAKTPNITSVTTDPAGGEWDVGNKDNFTLTVTSTVTDNGTLSYQWYENTTNSTTGGKEIGTDDKTLTLAKGNYLYNQDFYFYVVVTNTITDNGDGGKKTAAATSNAAKVTVKGNLVNARAPSITGQPQGGTWDVTEKDKFILTVTAANSDEGTLSYQWYKGTSASATGGTTIGTDETLTLEKARYPSDGYLYFYVVVTNTITDNDDGGVKTATATSNVATVTVSGNGVAMVNAQQPSITGQPAGGTWNVANDASYTLTVTASVTDGGTLSYQWHKNTTNSTNGGETIGTDNATLTLEKAHYTGDGDLYFYVVVTNTNNAATGTKTATTTSNAATVTVSGNGVAMVNAQQPSITGQPQSNTWNVNNANTFTLTVTATSPDEGELSYQWYKNTTNSTTGGETIGTNSATLTLAKANYTGDGNLYFYVVVTNTITDNGDGGVKTAIATGNVATVTVTGNGVAMVNAQQPSIIGQPTGGTWDVGSANTFTLTVTATVTDGGTRSYQWYRNTTDSTTGGETIGTDNATLTLAKANYTGDGAYYFYVVVTNTITDNDDGGVKTATATSNAAAVTVSGNGVGMVNAQQPDINGQPQGGTWNVGSANTFTLTVTASVTDAGTLSYQWHKNTTNSTNGGETIGTDNATLTLEKASYTSDGDLYFYVVVTNTITDNGDGGVKTAAVTSNAVAVTVSGNPHTVSIDIAFSGGPGAQKTVAIKQTITGNLSKSGNGSIALTINDPSFTRYEWYVGSVKAGDNDITLAANSANLKVGANLITAVAYTADNTPWSADFTVYVTE